MARERSCILPLAAAPAFAVAVISLEGELQHLEDIGLHVGVPEGPLAVHSDGAVLAVVALEIVEKGLLQDLHVRRFQDQSHKTLTYDHAPACSFACPTMGVEQVQKPKALSRCLSPANPGCGEDADGERETAGCGDRS